MKKIVYFVMFIVISHGTVLAQDNLNFDNGISVGLIGFLTYSS